MEIMSKRISYAMRIIKRLSLKRAWRLHKMVQNPNAQHYDRLLGTIQRSFFGFEGREDVGDFMEAPSWGSAFPGREGCRER
jgi:uncharacterized protein YfbU (UPF0304 family)